jgi:penicillin-binding protein 1B
MSRPKPLVLLRLRLPSGGRRWLPIVLVLIASCGAVLTGALAYYAVTFSRQIEARLHGERDRVLPRVFARPVVLWRGQAMSERQLVDRLNELAYAERVRAEKPGEFAIAGGVVSIVPRSGNHDGERVRVSFERPAVRKASAALRPLRITRLEADGRAAQQIVLDPPLLTALMRTGREKRRQVPLAAIPARMVQAVLAIEDRRFYGHPGIDPIRMVGALFTNVFGERRYLEGASTLTQQLARNFFLTEQLAEEAASNQRSLRRKLLEQFMAIILERQASKDEILELYLNDVYLGQRGSFAIHGVAEAARLFFGKDVSNLSLSEAATIAGVIQSPSVLSPFHAEKRCRERRNVVLRAMVDAGFITDEAATRAVSEPLRVVQRALEAQAPYFVDLVGQVLAEELPGVTRSAQALDVYTTLDLQMQRIAQDALRDGLEKVDKLLSRRKRRREAQAALIAIDPATGEVLALVGGRSYNRSQYNRAISARRQPGSVFKPFVYLAAFERAAEEGRGDVTPATLVMDEHAPIEYAQQVWNPGNYENEYDGEVTLRRALAMSRNLATIHVAELAGFDRVAGLWRRIGVGAKPHAYPSITLGVFEATPFDIATAYTIFPNEGMLRPLRVLHRVVSGGQDQRIRPAKTRRIARADTTFLVTNMMRSVINEGTAAGVRASGFAFDAAGKTGTTNDLRDAWFVGFTPELLAVVWVGLDDNRPLGLSGTQAALPIWTQFMSRALTGHREQRFDEPEGIVWSEIDRDTGKIAAPTCPRVISEAFLSGTEPAEYCQLHRF